MMFAIPAGETRAERKADQEAAANVGTGPAMVGIAGAAQANNVARSGGVMAAASVPSALPAGSQTASPVLPASSQAAIPSAAPATANPQTRQATRAAERAARQAAREAANNANAN